MLAIALALFTGTGCGDPSDHEGTYGATLSASAAGEAPNVLPTEGQGWDAGATNDSAAVDSLDGASLSAPSPACVDGATRACLVYRDKPDTNRGYRYCEKGLQTCSRAVWSGCAMTGAD